MSLICDGVDYLYWSNLWYWTALEVICIGVACLSAGAIIGILFMRYNATYTETQRKENDKK